MESNRIKFLEETLLANPSDIFARYALAIELSNSAQPTDAWPHFEYLLTHHPDYSATYLQAGMFLARQGRRGEAQEIFAKGVEVTRHQGNVHAQSELQAALESLSH